MGLADQSGGSATVQGIAGGIVGLTGRGIAWLLPLMVAVIFAIVLLRYGMNLGWIWLQELVVYMHSAVFLLTVAWAFQQDEHVRVDIFYRGKSERHKAAVNLLGTLLLVVPFSIYMLWMGWDYVASSWAVLEGSREAGGLDFVYLLKSLMLLLPALLLVQSYVTVSRCLTALKAKRPRA